MKELSIEEKARYYDRALAKAKEEAIDGYLDAVAVNDIFPELTESEDERMKKSFIRLVKAYYDVNFPTSEGFTREEMIAWLEKQVQACLSHDDEIMIKQLTEYFTTGKGLQNTNDTVVEWLADVKRKLEKQGKNNMSISEATKKKLEDNLNKALEKETPESWNEFLEKQGEHANFLSEIQVGDEITVNGQVCRVVAVDKLAWSEEDKETLDYIIDYIEKNKSKDTIYTKRTKVLEGMVDWLKSLKDRVQPKQECSEENEEVINLVCSILYSNFNENENFDKNQMCIGEIIDKLKSLKERYTWKPSTEQLAALYCAIPYIHCLSTRACAKSLYNDLKKLIEE